ncbi:brachyurin-like [Zophobas morio]|uniref:brachyurin-like n=1 Tax=Zophobas morio TaxID=2755281 RepID=UPI003082F455
MTRHMLIFFSLLIVQNVPTKASLHHDQSSEKSGRIIGGIDAHIAVFPFIAAVNVQTSNSRFFCGGTLYLSEWVITAGQCVDGAVLFTITTISFGADTLENEDDSRVTVATSTYFLHPDYNPQTLENDIGIIRLRMPITHTNYIKAIETLATTDLTIGNQLFTLGWGQTSDSDPSLAARLQVLYAVAITNEECRQVYGFQITDEMVCIVGSYNNGICYGDTGGPLVEVLRLGTRRLAGIASFISSNGCESTDPSGFTRITPYVSWITNVTRGFFYIHKYFAIFIMLLPCTI